MQQKSTRNDMAIVASYWLTKLGDALASAKTTLPWLLASLGAPAFFTGLLVPIRESGSLIPQLLFSQWVKRFAIRKGIFAAGCFTQGVCIAAIALGAVYFRGVTIGIWVALWLSIFSLARAFCSIASKDVLGKTIAKTKRGRLTGLSATLAGFISIAVGCVILWPSFKENTLLLLWVAAGAWLFATVIYNCIDEPGGACDTEKINRSTLLISVKGTFQTKDFRDFIWVRSLLMSSALASPFLVLMANQHTTLGLGGYIIAGGVASLLSGHLWGKFSDRNCRAVLTACGLFTSLICMSACVSLFLCDTPPLWLSVTLFFLLAVTHEGVRISRQIYVVNLAEGNRRTDYVAIGNTFIGVLLLIVGLISAALASLALPWAFGALGVAAFLACLLSLKLKKR